MESPINLKKLNLKIGDKRIKVNIDNSAEAAILEKEIPQGETAFLAYFDTEDGTLRNAFYIDIERVN
ncbi:hypothetical protein [Flavivirga jejuensis]|uniref:Uncharacterized protein n=1 Tax=Flavivirga jejuensis TaxID=870487 RepID=A0ABT8WSQ7_9FLAO|nr:hypothetical protein [Flavivirga jejuensis]MDO5976191.1 hypothetical protein [Flavivirga jejuensis]